MSSATTPGFKIIPSRSTDPETSHQAFEQAKFKAQTQLAYLLEAFVTKGPGTSEEAMNRTNGKVGPQSEYAKRTSDLYNMGLVRKTEDTKGNGWSGAQRIVFAATEAGKDYYWGLVWAERQKHAV